MRRLTLANYCTAGSKNDDDRLQQHPGAMQHTLYRMRHLFLLYYVNEFLSEAGPKRQKGLVFRKWTGKMSEKAEETVARFYLTTYPRLGHSWNLPHVAENIRWVSFPFRDLLVLH